MTRCRDYNEKNIENISVYELNICIPKKMRAVLTTIKADAGRSGTMHLRPSYYPAERSADNIGDTTGPAGRHEYSDYRKKWQLNVTETSQPPSGSDTHGPSEVKVEVFGDHYLIRCADKAGPVDWNNHVVKLEFFERY